MTCLPSEVKEYYFKQPENPYASFDKASLKNENRTLAAFMAEIQLGIVDNYMDVLERLTCSYR